MSKLATGIVIASALLSLAWCGITESSNRHEKEMFCMKEGKHFSDWSGGCKP